jgi:ribosomal protein L11 methylase PrmA
VDVNGSSFRDPSGFVYSEGNDIFRQVNQSYAGNYEMLLSSGLYAQLTDEKLLASHTAAETMPGAYKTLKPEKIPFISYPYEWCFEQYRAAALLTLDIQKRALEKGMSLKDASAYNVQFTGYSPVFIDTLSFEKHIPGRPWVAYGQFCSHFLAPLALMSYKDSRLGKMAVEYADGIPLDLAAKMLPVSSRLNPVILAHIHMHAASRVSHADNRKVNLGGMKVSKFGLLALIDSLESAVRGLKPPPVSTQWNDYYVDNNYSKEGFEDKKKTVSEMLDMAGRQELVWDLGANTGIFSRIASQKNNYTVAFDSDYGAAAKNYAQAVSEKETNLLPLVYDLTNPSPDIGWDNNERMRAARRGTAGCVMALALIHHLCIAANIPMEKAVSFFARIAKNLIIEFVPREDSQVKRLLFSREDIFTGYSGENFIREFEKKFEIIKQEKIAGSGRVIYLMRGE